MESIHCFYLVLIYVLSFSYIFAQNGQPCYLGYYQRGVCTTPRRCPPIRRGIVADNDIYPCDYGRSALICCPINNYRPGSFNDNDSSEENTSNSNNGRRGHRRNRPGRRHRPQGRNNSEINEPNTVSSISICENKCQEYYQQKPEVKKPEAGVFKPFVVGGINTKEKEFPHMAALGFGEKGEERWLCGGSLISERYILTAAHCLSTQDVGDVKWARMGVSNIKKINPEQVQDFEIVSRIKHPEYKPPLQYHDIGLVMIDKNVIFTEYVRPICLQTSIDLNNTIPIATGWGRTQYGGATSDDLKKVEISYFTISQCKENYANISPRQLPNGIVDETQICAGGLNEEKDTCQGDSGGPLQTKYAKYEKAYSIIGITSFGKACGIENSPGVYTRVSYYIPWIQQIVWPQ